MENIELLEKNLRDVKRQLVELRLEQNLKRIDNNSKIQEFEAIGNDLIKNIYDLKCKLCRYYISFDYSYIDSDYHRSFFQTTHYSEIDCDVDTTNSYTSNFEDFVKLRDKIIEKYFGDYMIDIRNIVIKRIK